MRDDRRGPEGAGHQLLRPPPPGHCQFNELSPPSSSLSPDFRAGQQARLAFSDPEPRATDSRSVPRRLKLTMPTGLRAGAVITEIWLIMQHQPRRTAPTPMRFCGGRNSAAVQALMVHAREAH